MDCNRHVCLKDLENYLKKAEYLDGYTPTEQKQVRKNIGAIGEADLASYITETKFIPLTHAELVDLIKDNKLGIGQVYAITDFQTIYESNVQNNVGQYITWGLDNNPSEVYTIMTIALSANTLLNRVVIVSEKYPNSYKWIVEYDYEPEVLQDGVSTKGKITYLKDTNNNVAYYDFKNVKSRRSRIQLNELGINITQDYLDLYTFNTQDFNEASETYNVYNNHLGSDSNNNVFIGNDCYNNVFEDGFRNNTFVSSCHNNQFQFDTYNNVFKYPVIYLTGSFNNLKFINNDYTSMDVNKQISKINRSYVISYLDSDTLTLQVYRI